MHITAEVKALSLVTEAEQKDFISWMWQYRERANFDMAVMSYPRTVMFRTFDEQGTLAFLPAQPILMFESLCARPGITDKQMALSLWRIGEEADKAMRDTGMHEAYFITNDQAEADSTEKHGWAKRLYDPERKEWLMKRRIPEAQNAT